MRIRRNKKIGIYTIDENSWTDIGQLSDYQKVIKSLYDDFKGQPVNTSTRHGATVLGELEDIYGAETVKELSIKPGLMRDQVLAQDFLRFRARLGRAVVLGDRAASDVPRCTRTAHGEQEEGGKRHGGA